MLRTGIVSARYSVVGRVHRRMRRVCAKPAHRPAAHRHRRECVIAAAGGALPRRSRRTALRRRRGRGSGFGGSGGARGGRTGRAGSRRAGGSGAGGGSWSGTWGTGRAWYRRGCHHLHRRRGRAGRRSTEDVRVGREEGDGQNRHNEDGQERGQQPASIRVLIAAPDGRRAHTLRIREPILWAKPPRACPRLLPATPAQISLTLA